MRARRKCGGRATSGNGLGTQLQKACTVHEEDEDGLDEQYEEAVLSDDELATKIEELREEEHKRIQDEVASRKQPGKEGRRAGTRSSGGSWACLLFPRNSPRRRKTSPWRWASNP